jgi:hypothetical protein
MKKLALVMLVVLFAAAFAVGQTYTSGTGLTGDDVLGAHNNGGRGCAGCHAPHSGAAGGGGNVVTGGAAYNDPLSGTNALFGQDVTPLYNVTFTFGNGYAEGPISQPAAYTTNQDELRGILMCLACHDGNVAKGQMMTGQSWEQSTHILPAGVYGTRPIPTLLGNDSGNGNNSGYGNDHPVGTQATLGALRLVGTNGAAGALTVSFDAINGITNIVPTPGSTYATFAGNYGYPAIAGSAWEWGFHMPAGSTDTSTAFMTCTTCHNQHVMYIYKAPRGKQAGSAIAGGTYPTYFFVNGPYNPGAGNNNPALAASATQFCRQCHTGEQNEALGVNSVHTQF